MAGDYSRFSFRPRRRVSTVAMQQGRVQLDSDWNEQGRVVDGRIRNLARDVWGPAWVSAPSTPHAFELTPIAGPDLAIGEGRLYAQGLAPEVLPGEQPTWQKQPFLPVPQAVPAGTAIAYLDVFERELTWVEEPELLEKALHGVDTATRRQVAWQVKLEARANATCGTDLDALFSPSAGRLSTRATATPASDDPCILPPSGGFRGLENRLYRIQIHAPGPVGVATFKWSRENASIVSPVLGITAAGLTAEVQVLRIGRDAVLRFSLGDWVELTDDRRELMGQSGDMWRVGAIDETTRTLSLTRVNPVPPLQIPFGTTPAELAARHTRLIRWDQSFELHDNVLDADGLMPTGAGPIPLEDGVQAFFGADPVGGAMRIDDHWSFEARTVDGSILELTAAPPDGVRHVYVPLAVVSAAAGGGFSVLADCRNLVPKDGTTTAEKPPCECCTLCVGRGGDVADLKSALEKLGTVAPDPATPVRLCLMPGDHDLSDELTIERPNTLVVGCFPRSRLQLRRGALRFTGSSSGLVDVVVIGEAEPALVVVSGLEGGTDQLVRGCRFEADLRVPAGLLAEAAVRLQVHENRFLGAGIAISGAAREVRLEANAVEQFARSAVMIDGSERPREIEILGNRLVDGLGAGIEAVGVIERLTVAGNEISLCRGEALALGKTAGGLVVEAVDDLVVRDNRIVGNGSDAPEDCAGIRVRRGRGVEIVGNRIEANGRGRVDGNPVTGGIVIDEARPGPDTEGNGRLGLRPAVVVADNIVRAARGHALFVLGRGDMRIADNTLVTVVGVARGARAPALDVHDLASVMVIGIPALAGLAEKLIEAAAEAAAQVAAGGDPASFPVKRLLEEVQERAPGRVLVQANQIALERHERRDSDLPPLSAVTVWGFEDVDLSHNQVELHLDEVRYCLNALVVAWTTRQIGNRFTEPEEPQEPQQLCLASLLSLGHELDTCSQNQGTHCILPFAPRLIDLANLVAVPTSLCRRQG